MNGWDLLRSFILGPLLALGLGAGPLWAITSEAPPPDVLSFDRFIGVSGPICEHQPAAVCVDLAFAFADADGDGRLSADELHYVRDALRAWTEWRRPELREVELRGIGLGLWLVESLGIGQLHALYDADGDGFLSRHELLADVELDDRPLREVLLDPQAVDRQAIARRLGALAPLLDRALP